MQNIVVGFLNSDETVVTGLINDISLGGGNFTHELGMAPVATIHSIDLIAESNSLNDLPCEYALRSLINRCTSLGIKNIT